MSSRVAVGTRIVTTVTFTPAETEAIPSPAPEDPTTIKLRVKDNLGVTVDDTYLGVGSTIERLSEGVFSGYFDPDDDGDWYYSWIGTGNVVVASIPTKITVIAGLAAP